MNNLKVAILLIVIFVLAVAGFYYFYLKQVSKSQNLSLEPLQSPKTNFPSATASASPKTQSTGEEIKQPGQVAGASRFPSTQPQTGIGQTQVEDAGIEIQTPQDQTEITSPVTVSGTANVPNSLIVEVKDAAGQVLGVRKTAACFGNQACPFSVSIVFTNSSTLNGQITVYSPSLSANSPEYSQSANVTFK